MVIDTSALMAILLAAPERPIFLRTRETGKPLLFKSGDFARIDIANVIP